MSKISFPNFNRNAAFVNNNSNTIDRKKKSYANANVNFAGKPPALSTEEKEMIHKFTADKMGRFGRFVSYLKKNDSECQTQIINGVFTSTLAPFVIAFNPVSKQDKKVKEYSALRQPISAAIALSIGLGMTVGTNRLIDSVSKKGYVELIDLSLMRSEKDLKKKYAQDKELAKTYETADDYVKAMQKEDVAKSAKKIYGDPEKLLAEAKPEEAKRFEKYINKNNLHKMTVQNFMEDKLKFKFVENEEQKLLDPDAYKNKLEDLKALDVLKKFGFFGDEVKEDDLLRFVKKSKSNELENEIEAAGIPKENSHKIATKIGKNDSLNIQWTRGTSKGDGMSFGQLLKYIGDDSLEPKNNLNTKMSDYITKFAEPFKEFTYKDKDKNLKFALKVEKEGKEIPKKLENFAEQIIKDTAKRAEKDFKNNKKFVNIITNLVFTAISCSVLNWAYPRIMEKCFPNLVGDSKKGGNK